MLYPVTNVKSTDTNDISHFATFFFFFYIGAHCDAMIRSNSEYHLGEATEVVQLYFEQMRISFVTKRTEERRRKNEIFTFSPEWLVGYW